MTASSDEQRYLMREWFLRYIRDILYQATNGCGKVGNLDFETAVGDACDIIDTIEPTEAEAALAAAEQRAQDAEAREDALRERERQVQDAVRLFVNRLDGIGMWADERLSGEERRWLTSELVKANTDLEAVSGILKARALLRAAEGGERDA